MFSIHRVNVIFIVIIIKAPVHCCGVQDCRTLWHSQVSVDGEFRMEGNMKLNARLVWVGNHQCSVVLP